MPNALSDMSKYCKIEKGHISPAPPRILGTCLLYFHFEMAEPDNPAVTNILEPEDQTAEDSCVDEVCLSLYILN